MKTVNLILTSVSVFCLTAAMLIFNKKIKTQFDAEPVVIRVEGTVNKPMSDAVVSQLIEASKEGKSVVMVISSFGGSVIDGNVIIDYMERLPIPNLTTYCISVCASMAGHIFMAGKERVMAPSASVLFHPMSLQVGGNIEDINNYLKHVNGIRDRLHEKVLRMTDKDNRPLLERSLTEDIWLSADTMLSIGLATKVGILPYGL